MFYKLTYFVPEYGLEKTKQALFEAGAGNHQHYDRVSWQVQGIGQFRPLAGANPELGQAGRLCQVPEYRVEMICDEKSLKNAIKALRENHPYEAPAIEVYALKYPTKVSEL